MNTTNLTKVGDTHSQSLLFINEALLITGAAVLLAVAYPSAQSDPASTVQVDFPAQDHAPAAHAASNASPVVALPSGTLVLLADKSRGRLPQSPVKTYGNSVLSDAEQVFVDPNIDSAMQSELIDDPAS